MYVFHKCVLCVIAPQKYLTGKAKSNPIKYNTKTHTKNCVNCNINNVNKATVGIILFSYGKRTKYHSNTDKGKEEYLNTRNK